MTKLNNYNRNIGWAFQKEYFFDLKYILSDKKQNYDRIFQNKNKSIYNESIQECTFISSLREKKNIKNQYQYLELYTIYPGLLIGTGNPHATGEFNEEIKLGFTFDYAYGLPVLPGSTVKGALRSYFPNNYKNEQSKKEVESYLEFVIKDELEISIKEGYSISALEKCIFDGIGCKGEVINPYVKDIFFDAFPKDSKNKKEVNRDEVIDKVFLGNDNLAPHKDKYKDPNLIQFLKVLPNVSFFFQFRLSDEGMESPDKLKLFEFLLKNHGIGAKTNVGYGQFSEKPIKISSDNNEARVQQRKFENSIKDYSIYRIGNRIDATIIDIQDGYLFFEISMNKDEFVKKKDSIISNFERNKKRRVAKGKPSNYQELNIGDSCQIEVKRDFTLTEHNFSVVAEWS